ncbi:hypothetical protein, partial [Anaerobacillus sp. 1_MG-2023]|uniref:hypothetical protein n=1 Tax=Anaerobacillus sp. 1_MG-2023 TaxID=3062655 RepID=UPI0026E1994A
CIHWLHSPQLMAQNFAQVAFSFRNTHLSPRVRKNHFILAFTKGTEGQVNRPQNDLINNSARNNFYCKQN